MCHDDTIGKTDGNKFAYKVEFIYDNKDLEVYKMKTGAIFILIFVISLFSLAYAADVNHFCKTECIGKGRTNEFCNSLCSLYNDNGQKTKDTTCLSSCLKAGNTNYYCYDSCTVAIEKKNDYEGMQEKISVGKDRL